MASDELDIDESPCGSEFPLEVYNDLQCPICLEFFRHPIILPCSHVLCRSPCAENLFDFNFIRCPVCRENCYISGGIGSLPRVIVLESIIEKYRSERRKVIHNATKNQKTYRTATATVRGLHQGNVSSPRSGACALISPVSDTVATSTNILNISSSAADDVSERSRHSQSKRCHEDSIHLPRNDTVLPVDHLPVNAAQNSSTNVDTPLTSVQTFSRNNSIPLTSSQPFSGNEALPLTPLQTLSQSLQRSVASTHALTLSTSPPSSLNLSGFASSASSPSATGLSDVIATSVTSCTRHGADVSVYCRVCQRCVCTGCGDVEHISSHETCSLDDAALQAKNKLTLNLEKMISSQVKVVTSLDQQRQHVKDLEEVLGRKNEEINMQCDSLLAEVEHKRSLFLADLEQEERTRRQHVDEAIEIFEKILGASQSLAYYTKDMLEKDAATVLQVTPALNEQLLGSILDCEACQVHPDALHLDPTQGKVVDLRKEQALLRDIHYLNPPSAPTIDLTRCARSDSTVALFLVPPRGSDVIDSLVVRYCSEDQKTLGIEETLTFQFNHIDHLSPSGQQSCGPLLSYVALVEPLLTATTYLFCVTAANMAGHSANSDVVQCVTLTPRESVVPVPVILETMCKTYTSSIRVFTPSPHDVAPEQSISHFLLYRPRDRKWLWRSVALCGRPEHRVFGLDPETQYEFVVMATNPRGECQLSDRLVLETDGSS